MKEKLEFKYTILNRPNLVAKYKGSINIDLFYKHTRTNCIKKTKMNNEWKKSSWHSTHLFHWVFHWLKHPQNSSFDMAWICDVFLLMSSISSNLLPLRWIFNQGKKKSYEAQSGEYGGCCLCTILWFAKNIEISHIDFSNWY